MIGATFANCMLGSNQNHSMKSTKLTADDVPEASLGDREPEKFKMVELRVWLQCRVASRAVEVETQADYVQL